MREGFLELEVSSQIVDLVEPQLLDASQVISCQEINLSASDVDNPSYTEGGSEEKYIRPRELLDRMIDEGWKLITICWKRSDGSANYGHDPVINHKLVAVLVKERDS